ncbi:O-antigen ligase family protein [Microbacterium sp.]|uniref:O-antigen ligase family protein n=1 Tax=Microbacterium sp. TaxID=51671 RepID=UPI0039E63C23
MTAPAAPAGREGWGALLASAAFARAYTIAVFAAVFSSFAIERMAGRVTAVTIVAGLGVLGVAVLFVRRREISPVRLVPSTLVLFLVWALISVAWSTDRSLSWWGWVSAAGIALLGVTIGHIRDTLQTARALGDVMRWLLSISLGLEILSGVLLDLPLGFLGIQGNIAQAGPIQGLFGTRNLLGFVAVVALVTFLVEYRTQSVPPGLSLFSVAVGGLAAALSDSPTVGVLALAVTAATAALTLVRRARPDRRSRLQWLLGGTVVLGLAVAYLARHPIIAFLGAGSDFSMRAALWENLLGYVRLEPVHGFGWFGPWAQLEFPFASINYMLRERHASALSAYFDVLLQLGWAGLVLFLSLAGFALVRSWLIASERRSIVYAWTPLLLVALLVDSLFESFTLAGPGLLLLVICAVRAGHARSWRERLDARIAGPDLPLAPAPPRPAR